MYQEASGQVFSSKKSKLFLGAMNNEKKQKVKDIFGFDEGGLLETYLGILLIQGRVTKEIPRPLVDKIKKRATGWAGVRGAIEEVRSESGWVIGDGSCIDIWRDIWCSLLSLKDLINNDNIPWQDLHAKVSSIIVEGRWSIPYNLLLIFYRLGVDINNLKININKADRRVWKLDLVGKFSVNGDFEVTRNNGQTCWCLRVPLHPCKRTVDKSCFWELLQKGEVKLNTDGAAQGNLGTGGIGCIFRDCDGKVLDTLAKGLGLVTNYTAKCKVIIQGVKSAASNGWLIAWVESDSKAAVDGFSSDNIPCPWKRTGEMQKEYEANPNLCEF
ncbi:hypothetical protein GIB67_008775 [Kingdonia uniflora]|uniref:RNase H type-1 domain-containing protein n=1 Tax=Kingdonia uniflora TaxID=39325 RepID=A0A7J7P5V3_9MAGN|nr:hypothetical protein GIB67_008775 [Kingdonia uniflora]